jgi:hypothetical protein
MSLPTISNDSMPLRSVPRLQPTLPPQQPRLAPLDVPQPNPLETHFNSPHHPELFNNADLFPTTPSNVPQGSMQNVNPSPSQPLLVNGQLPWGWPWVIPPQANHTCQHTSTNQNFQATGPCPACATNPSLGPAQFGSAQPAPGVQDTTTQFAEAVAPSASSSCASVVDRTAPQARPPASEPLLFRPGAADAGGPSRSTKNAQAQARKSRRVCPAPTPVRNPRRVRERELPLVRVKEEVEWVRPDVMKMTLWFNWSPTAEAEAHEAWG